MEPFSLLPFLQSLIRADFNTKTDEKSPNETEKADGETNAKSTTSSLQEEKENACVHFFSIHDERVKRTKRHDGK